MSLTCLKSSMSSIISDSSWPKRSARSASLAHQLAEAAVVGETRELIGHRLLGDQLVQGDVLDRRRHLPEPGRGRPRARAGANASPRRATVITPTFTGRLADLRSGARQRVDAVLLARDDVVLAQRVGLGGQRRGPASSRRARPASASAPSRPLTAIVPYSASHAAERCLDDDLEQSLAIEARSERLADPPHRPIDLDLLAAQLLHLGGQPVAHLVELARQTRHLVVADNRHLAAEVALADPPRGLEHRRAPGCRACAEA